MYSYAVQASYPGQQIFFSFFRKEVEMSRASRVLYCLREQCGCIAQLYWSSSRYMLGITCLRPYSQW